MNTCSKYKLLNRRGDNINFINETFWAKKQEKNGRFEWLSLKQHLEDTRRISGLLWEHWMSSGQKQLIINSLNIKSEEKAKALVQFLGSIHDFGKATPAFQTMEGYNCSKDLEFMLLEKLEREGFKGISNPNLSSPKKTHHALASQCLLSWYGVGDDICSIVGAHHGKPIDNKILYKNQKSYDRNYFQVEDSNDEIHKKWKYEQNQIFQWALEINDFTSIEELPHILQPAQVILSGLIIMADWIASNENYFPLLPIDMAEDENQQKRIEYGWNKWNKSDLWEAQQNSDSLVVYKDRFGYEPKSVQEVFFNLIKNTENPGIFILEAPMGVGKTEAALVASEQLAHKTGRNGLFFGLPTQATSNGIFPRIVDWLKRVDYYSKIKNPEWKYSLRLVHGKAALNEEFRSLAQNINLDEGEEEKETVIVNEWFSGRKTSSLDQFVVGTIDHFLLTALKQKHLALRHLGFSGKVVVIDEVHAYDAYMSQYLFKALRWMGAYGVPVVILSATLPADRRDKIIEYYMRGTGVDWRNVKKPSTGLMTCAYPLVTYNDGDMIKQETNFDKEEEISVEIIRKNNENIYNLVENLVNDGGIIGIIVNTVKRAQEIAKICAEKFGEEIVELLHSNFIDPDRTKKEKNLLNIIGKGANRPIKKIIIGTQVIEQSLDIDFDVLISELAPMDLLIQRIGRLHRHKILRPLKHKNPIVYVLGTDENLEFEGGSSFVYGDYLLARTQYFLPKEMSLPRDISVLVQKVYNNDTIELEEKLKSIYNEMQDKHFTNISKKELKAKAFRIDKPVLKNSRANDSSLIGWLKDRIEYESEERSYAQVRDIQDIIEVIALKKIGDGYGIFGENIDISSKIEDFKIGKKVAQQTLKLPKILSATYNVDKTIEELEGYYNKYLKNWQNQPWLKGALGIIFDENNSFILGGMRLVYDEKYGLTYERK